MARLAQIIAVLLSLVVVGAAAVVAYPYAYLWGAGRYWDQAEPEVHLVPAGFVGPVVILLNDPGAPPPERARGARVFRVPPSGVLRSRLGVNYGWGLPAYFYTDARGRRTPLAAGAPCERDLPRDPVQACLLGHTTVGGLPDRAYQAYAVGRRADQQDVWGAERFVDSVVYGRPAP